MRRPLLEVADVFRDYGEEYRRGYKGRLSGVQLRAMRAIENCRTAALGGHIERCDHCGHQHHAYNSCRNRNCPKCQSSTAHRWLQARQAELLPVSYFHVVFTVPHEIAAIALANQRLVYGILFRCVSHTLLQIAANDKRLGGQIAILAVLHTWGQNLNYHPHIHCVIPGGVIKKDGSWITGRKHFLFPVKVLSKLFRGKFLAALNRAFSRGKFCFTGKLFSLNSPATWNLYLSAASKKLWVVYCKRPFAGPEQVLKYLARYTHRIAISNHRLVSLKDGNVIFRWKDYRHQARTKLMSLPAKEFIRRFLMHVVPSGFVRIRHYGFLANRNRVKSIQHIQSLLHSFSDSSIPISSESTLTAPQLCPVCKKGKMLILQILSPMLIQDSS